MSLLYDSLFLSVAFSHFVVDVLNGQSSVLFAYLSGPLMLSNTALGFLSIAYTVSGALMQPIFGYVTDRVGPRWVVAGGVAWMGLAYTIGILTPGRTALVFLVLASLGSGAFHPAGTMQATARGRTHFIGQETTATSYFFLFGQVGLFAGPFVAGYLLEFQWYPRPADAACPGGPNRSAGSLAAPTSTPPRACEASRKSCSPARPAGEPGHGGIAGYRRRFALLGPAERDHILA